MKPPSTDPVLAARTLLGRELAALVPLRWADAAPPGLSALALAVCQQLDPQAPTNAECANFVASVLRATGALPPGAALTSVPELRAALEAAGRRPSHPAWQEVPPGAVVVLQTRSFDGQPDPDGHVVLFTGLTQAQPHFIGANPIDEHGARLAPSGAQRVNELPLSAFQAWAGACFEVTAVYAR